MGLRLITLMLGSNFNFFSFSSRHVCFGFFQAIKYCLLSIWQERFKAMLINVLMHQSSFSRIRSLKSMWKLLLVDGIPVCLKYVTVLITILECNQLQTQLLITTLRLPFTTSILRMMLDASKLWPTLLLIFLEKKFFNKQLINTAISFQPVTIIKFLDVSVGTHKASSNRCKHTCN